MKRLVVILFVIVAGIVAFFLVNATMDSVDGLGGDPWTLVGLKENGKDARKEELKDVKIQFTKTRVIWTVPTQKGMKELEGAFKIDPSKQPKAIEIEQPFTDDERPVPGIYEIKGDILFIAIGDRRPTDFSSRGGIVFAFKR
jgi:uncharacterized protein (TIGR03067 family)